MFLAQNTTSLEVIENATIQLVALGNMVWLFFRFLKHNSHGCGCGVVPNVAILVLEGPPCPSYTSRQVTIL